MTLRLQPANIPPGFPGDSKSCQTSEKAPVTSTTALQLTHYTSIKGIALSSQFSNRDGGETPGGLALSALTTQHPKAKGRSSHSLNGSCCSAHPSTNTQSEKGLQQKPEEGAQIHKPDGFTSESTQ